jgi:ribonucleoside-diphosphate reductase alpha chain
MPADTTPDDIAEAYRWGWELGLKALAIYRDGSKQSQPLSTKSEGNKAADATVARPRRERLPDTRHSVTHKFSVAGHEGYITVGLYEDGRPGELFITMAKEGSTVGGLMDSFGTAISICLQYGVPLSFLVDKFSHSRFEPMGHTSNPDIRIAKSLVDYIFRWLGLTFMPGFGEANGLTSTTKVNVRTIKPTETRPTETKAADSSTAAATAPGRKPDTKSPASDSNGHRSNGQVAANGKSNGSAMAAAIPEESSNGTRDSQFARFQSDAPSCDNCGAITVRNGNCYLCHNCGNSMGCS